MKHLIFFAFAALGVAQTVVNPSGLTLSADGQAATQAFMLTQRNGLVGVTLTSPMDAVTTTANVSDSTNITGASELIIDGEAMTITNKAARVLTVVRGDLGTTAIVHANAATVDTLKYPTIKVFMSGCVINAVQQFMDWIEAGKLQCPTCSTNTQITAIQTAKQALATAKSGAVQ